MKKLFAVVIALVAAQLLSGCYTIREVNWSKDKVKLGENTKLTLNLQPAGSAEMARGGVEGDARFFLYAFGTGSAPISFKRPVFDAKDVTDQKVKMGSREDLIDVLDSGNCPFFPPIRRGPPANGGEGIWSTPDAVSSETNKFVDATLKAKPDAAGEPGGFVGIVISGYWLDDGDDVPEDPESTDDEIQCTGSSTTSFLIKNG